MPLSRKLSFHFQVEKSRKERRVLLFTLCLGASVVHSSSGGRWSLPRVILSLCLEHLRASCKHEAVPLQNTNQSKHFSVHFPKQGCSRMRPVQPCDATPSLQDPSRLASLCPFLPHPGSSPKPCVIPSCMLVTLFSLGEVLSLALSFVTFESTALSFWKNPSTGVYPEFAPDQVLAGHSAQASHRCEALPLPAGPVPEQSVMTVPPPGLAFLVNTGSG